MDIIKVQDRIRQICGKYNPEIYFKKDEILGWDVIILIRKSLGLFTLITRMLNNFQESALNDYKIKIYDKNQFLELSKIPNSIEHDMLVNMRGIARWNPNKQGGLL